jgi:hypothetical protein
VRVRNRAVEITYALIPVIRRVKKDKRRRQQRAVDASCSTVNNDSLPVRTAAADGDTLFAETEDRPILFRQLIGRIMVTQCQWRGHGGLVLKGHLWDSSKPDEKFAVDPYPGRPTP